MANPLSELYVDPSIAADSGTGTSGDPYGDLQYCLDTGTRDATHGTRINVKSGTSESLSAVLDFTTFGAGALGAPVVIEGYTSTAGDGGQGSVDCNANQFINAPQHVGVRNMEIFDGPASDYLVELGLYGCIFNCEVHTTSGHGVSVSNYATCIGNNIYDVGDATHDMIYDASGGFIQFNYCRNGANECRYAIHQNVQRGAVSNNIISLDGASIGIHYGSSCWGARAIGNTIYSVSGTGHAINVAGGAVNTVGLAILNNYMEGFSGASGSGVFCSTSSYGDGYFGNNTAYNCGGNEFSDFLNESVYLAGNNTVLTASGIAKGVSDVFSNRFVFYKPVDTGGVEMLEEGYPEINA